MKIFLLMPQRRPDGFHRYHLRSFPVVFPSLRLMSMSEVLKKDVSFPPRAEADLEE